MKSRSGIKYRIIEFVLKYRWPLIVLLSLSYIRWAAETDAVRSRQPWPRALDATNLTGKESDLS